MLEHHGPMEENQPEHHHHNCGSLFGCGEEQGTGVVREDIKDASFTRQAADRLLHMDEVNQENLDNYLSTRGRFRRKLLQASSFMGMLAAVGPWFSKAGHSGEEFSGGKALGDGQPSGGGGGEGRVHVVESNNQTVHLGVFDTTLPPIIKIDSGDTVSFPNTWSHFLNQLQPGVPVDKLAQIRVSNPGRGPHSIIGPIFVNDAQPGDVLEIRYKKLLPFNWGASSITLARLVPDCWLRIFPRGR